MYYANVQPHYKTLISKEQENPVFQGKNYSQLQFLRIIHGYIFFSYCDYQFFKNDYHIVRFDDFMQKMV